MNAQGNRPGNPDRLLLVVLLALFMLLDPVRSWWAVAGLPWYVPYLGWGVLVLLISLTSGTRGNNEP